MSKPKPITITFDQFKDVCWERKRHDLGKQCWCRCLASYCPAWATMKARGK